MGWFEDNPIPGTSYPYPQDFPNAGGLPTTTVGSGGSGWGGETGGGARSQGWPPGWPTQFTMQFPNPASSEAARQAAWQRYDAGFNFDGTQRAGAGSTGGSAGGTLQPPNGDWQSWFMSLVAGKPWNQQTLNEILPTLQQYGIQITPPNANGDQTKINVPGIGWVRVGFGEGHPVWIPQGADSGSSGGDAGQGAGGSGGGQLGLNGPFGATPFDFHYNASDPAYQFIQKEVLGAIQNSQFARGTGLTGGAAKELQDRAAGLASMEYGNEFDRAYRSNALNFSQGLAANQNQFGQNYQLAGLGLNATTGDVNAAAGLGSTGSSYANQVGSLYGDIGNVNAGNIAGSAQARNNFYTGLLNGLPVGSRPYNAY